MASLSRPYRWLIGATILVAVAVPGWLAGWGWHRSSAAPPPSEPPAEIVDSAVRVETIRPLKGGLVRCTSQPGSAHSFESVDIFAKISGYLLVQHVDIGSRVRKGDLLADVDVPELAKDVVSAAASHEQALSEVDQSEARVESALVAERGAKERISQAQAEVERCDAQLELAQKQYDRIHKLNGLKGIDARVVDEKAHQVQSAKASHRAAESAVAAAKQLALAATSRVSLAKADLQVSQAKVRVAQVALERAKIMAAYQQIRSPYDGVVTCRNFHRGAFIRSPEQGGQVPLVAVDRTDLMRVTVRIPEPDIPYVQRGDVATIHFDALPDREFKAPISRIADEEEAQTRTMLAEIDLPNPDELIHDHMFGRVDIELDGAPEGVTIPSACLAGHVVDSRARVFVVRDRQAQARDVEIGRDTGVSVEILSGIGVDDEIVFRPAGSLTDGTDVICKPAANTNLTDEARKLPR